MGEIIRYKEDTASNFEGTIIDIETVGEFNRIPQYSNDSRQYANIQQVIFGFINGKGLRVFCAKGTQAIDTLKALTAQLLDRLERPFYAFNTEFESGVLFHQLGRKVIFDGELQEYKYETKSEAVGSLGIPNYEDPFHDQGLLCMKAWENGEFEKAIFHNRACLLKERDILLKRGYRPPSELNFNQ
ncbi:MAG TPA: hypothetical protein G4O01_06270 [Dehalococcoidia bacterium]|jgi:hypothetical protein|nr:hypothetical protein [Dehalococcoidia bacterium]